MISRRGSQRSTKLSNESIILEGRVNVLESEFDEFKEMDVMWAQEMEVRIDGIREELGLVTSGTDSDSDCDRDLEVSELDTAESAY